MEIYTVDRRDFKNIIIVNGDSTYIVIADLYPCVTRLEKLSVFENVSTVKMGNVSYHTYRAPPIGMEGIEVEVGVVCEDHRNICRAIDCKIVVDKNMHSLDDVRGKIVDRVLKEVATQIC